MPIGFHAIFSLKSVPVGAIDFGLPLQYVHDFWSVTTVAPDPGSHDDAINSDIRSREYGCSSFVM
jgi:hypothetical protein